MSDYIIAFSPPLSDIAGERECQTIRRRSFVFLSEIADRTARDSLLADGSLSLYFGWYG